MKTFNSLRDIEKWIGTQQGQKSVLNEDNIRKILIDAGNDLRGYLVAELNKYYSSYSPTVYKRTGATYESIQVSPPKKISINEWSIEIFFDESGFHKSVMGEDQPDGYSPWLIHSGWKTKLDATLDIDRFTRFEGTNFMNHAISEFNRNNKHGLKVQLFYNGKDVTNKTWRYGK